MISFMFGPGKNWRLNVFIINLGSQTHGQEDWPNQQPWGLEAELAHPANGQAQSQRWEH